MTPSMIFSKTGVDPSISYILNLPSHEAVTRYLPVGSHEADLTDFVLSDNKDTLSVSCTFTIFTNKSLLLASDVLDQFVAYSPHTATRSPLGSTDTHLIATPGDRVIYPVKSFWG